MSTNPKFVIVEAPSIIEGWVNEEKTIDVTVKNYGQQAGEVEVRLIDHNHEIVDARRITIAGGGTGTVSLSIILPSQYGEYSWYIQLYNVSRNTIDDSKALVVKANDIHFQIVDYTRTVNGFPNESKTVSVSVYNTGNTEGVAKIIIKDHNGVETYSNQATISSNSTYTFYAIITLPSTNGTYEWKVELWNQSLNRKEQEKTIYVVVGETEPAFLIIEYVPGLHGYTGQQVYVDVTVYNNGAVYGESIVRLLDHNGSVVVETDRRTIAPGGQYTVRLVFNLPSNPGEYIWFIQSYNATKSRIDHEVSLSLIVVAPSPLFKIVMAPPSIDGYVRETKTIDVSIQNQGEASGTCKVRLIDETANERASTTTSLNVNETKTVTLSFTMPVAGKYMWRIQTIDANTNNVHDSRSITITSYRRKTTLELYRR